MKRYDQLDRAAFERLARGGERVPVWREVSGDTETPVSAFLKLKNPRFAFLLESVEGGERWGRYSFVGDKPVAILRHLGATTLLEEQGRRTFIDSDQPLDAARTLLSRYPSARVEGLPRFVGGLVGYLGYGAVRWFEPRVPQRHGPDPGFPDGEWMLVDRLIVFDNLTHRLKLIAHANPGQYRTSKQAYQAAVAQLDDLEASLSRPIPREKKAPPKPSKLKDHFPRRDFEEAVAKAREYIAAGDCMQVVLSRRVTAQYSGEPFEVYRALRSVSPTPYLFFLSFGDRALAGASPEVLVRLEDGTVTVRPIAGTRRRGKTREEDLALETELKADPKERAEHVMLVDLGRNDIGRVSASGTVKVEEREVTERYSHVMHLVSQVTGKLKGDSDATDVIAATFPAGTVSGAPKVRAMEIIDELEPVSRGPYAGAVGYLGVDGAMDLAITIRSVAINGKELRLQAGAGVVHDSDPAKEYEETEHKMRATLTALGAELPVSAKPAKKAPRKKRVGRR